MKLYSPILLATPALGRKTLDGPMPVHKMNVSTAFTLPSVNVTEGMYSFSIAETGRKEGYHVNIHYQWAKHTKGIRNTLLGATGGAAIGAGAGYALAGTAAVGAAGTAAVGAAVGAVLFASLFVGIAIMAKDSIRLVKAATQEWKLIHTPSIIPGTFQLENIQRLEEKSRLLDAQLLGLGNTVSGTYAFRARLVAEPADRSNPGEKIVVLQFIDLTNHEAHWVVQKGNRLVLSEDKVTAFSLSPTTENEEAMLRAN